MIPRKKKKYRPWEIVAAVVASILLILTPLILVVVVYKVVSPFDDREFDRGVWMEHRGDTALENPRGRMSQALIDFHLRRRTPHEEVIDLLGEPAADLADPTTTTLRYHLGQWGTPPHPYHLTIQFDDQNEIRRVDRVRVED